MTIYLMLQLVYDALLLGGCGYALLRGGSDEKIGAALMLVASGATSLIVAMPAFSWRRHHWQIMLVDAALMAGLGWRASVSKRFWPLWASAFQLIDLMTHGLMLLKDERVRHAYVVSQAFWAYPILALIALGTWRRTRYRGRCEGLVDDGR